MHVPATKPRDREHLARQDQAIGDDDRDIRCVGSEARARCGVLEILGLLDRKAQIERGLLDRTGAELAPATGRPVGLRIHCRNVHIFTPTRVQTRHGEIRRASKN